MYGYGVNNHQLKRFTRDKIPGFLIWRPHGVMGTRAGETGQGKQEQGDKNGIYSRALRKLQRKHCKNTSKNGNFTQNTKIFAQKLAQSENLPYLCSVKKKENQNETF